MYLDRLALQLAELKCAAVAVRDDVPADALVLDFFEGFLNPLEAELGTRSQVQRLIEAGSRWAGIASFVVALGAVGFWLMG